LIHRFQRRRGIFDPARCNLTPVPNLLSQTAETKTYLQLKQPELHTVMEARSENLPSSLGADNPFKPYVRNSQE
jgi:hypothetical protein